MNTDTPEQILYRHTQQVSWMLAVSVVVLVVELGGIARGARRGRARFWPSVLAVAGFAFGAALASLTVVVRPNEVEAAFAGGLLRRRIDLATVESASVVSVPWYVGRGARFMPGGRVFYVWGSRAVELKLAGGGTFTIGSDEPYMLLSAVEQARRVATS